MYDLVINNGEIVDPEDGKYKADIGIENGVIEKISKNKLDGKKIIDAKSNMVSPGFIDIHMHEDNIKNGKIKFEIFNNMVQMGVTTAIGGNCGLGNSDIGSYLDILEKKSPPLNYAGMIGHGSLREKVACNDRYRKANDKELLEMKKLLKKGLEDGAIGLSFGLEYTPGATIMEMMELAEIVADYSNRLVAAHYRFDADRSLEAIAEMIIIARETGVKFQISHIGSCTAFGQMDTALNMIEVARNGGVDIMADVYPYDAFSTYVGSAVFDEGCFKKWGVDYNAIKVTEGKYKGKRCNKEIFEYIRENEPDDLVVAFVMEEKEVVKAMQHPLVMIASDGILNDGQGHPRAAGTFPRVLGKYVREENSLNLINAIDKITRMPAERAGLFKKGRIKEGYDADICIFDYDKIIDKSTFNNPTQKPVGIKEVIVGGISVVDKGNLVEHYPGSVLQY
ncbi:MAG: N-acyl-D-amino-acid deacylase family protein [Halanaerobiales bacterium]